MLVRWRDDSLDEKCLTSERQIHRQTRCWPLARAACRSNVPAQFAVY